MGGRESHPFIFSGLFSHSCSQDIRSERNIFVTRLGMLMLPCHHRVPLHSNYDGNNDTSSAVLVLCVCLGSSVITSRASSLAVTYLACKISEGTDRLSEQEVMPSHALFYSSLLQHGVRGYLFKVTGEIISINISHPFE